MTTYQAWFDRVWDEEVSRRTEETDYPIDTWRCSGRASKAWPDKESPEWWHKHGPEFVATWVNWRSAVGWPIWVTDQGEPAIELDLTVKHPDYEFPIRSITDRVMVNHDGELVIVDIKSGTYTPPAPVQLAINAECIDRQFGIRPAYGVFFSTRKGGYQSLHDLSLYPSDMLWDMAAKACQIREQELFIPSPNMLCVSCSVKDFCHLMLGERRHEYPPHRLPIVAT